MSLPFDTLKPRGPARIVDHGCSGMVSIYMSDERFVLKGSEVWANGRCYGRIGNADSKAHLAREEAIYRRLGSHPHILKYDGQVLVREGLYSLKLEHALGNLRQLILEYPPSYSTVLRTRRSCDRRIFLAPGLSPVGQSPRPQSLLSPRVIPRPSYCRNILVFPDRSAKIADFGGSKIDDEEPLDVIEETRYELPLRGRKWEDRPMIKRELFALGSAIYEIMAWKMPFNNLKNDEEVEKNYADEKFPDITGMLVGNVIRSCWTEQFESAEDVRIALEAFKTDLDTDILERESV